MASLYELHDCHPKMAAFLKSWEMILVFVYLLVCQPLALSFVLLDLDLSKVTSQFINCTSSSVFGCVRQLSGSWNKFVTDLVSECGLTCGCRSSPHDLLNMVTAVLPCSYTPSLLILRKIDPSLLLDPFLQLYPGQILHVTSHSESGRTIGNNFPKSWRFSYEQSVHGVSSIAWNVHNRSHYWLSSPIKEKETLSFNSPQFKSWYHSSSKEW